jgi:hypothetical protein
MRTEDWIKAVLSDNQLAQVAEDFKVTGEPCWHLDRHVIDTFLRLPVLSDASIAVAGCLAGIALLRAWEEERKRVLSTRVLISSPVLIIDDEWIKQESNAPPPHVYVCLAMMEKNLEPVDHPRCAWNEIEKFPIGEVRRHSAFLHGCRVEGSADSGRLGAWFIRLLSRSDAM